MNIHSIGKRIAELRKKKQMTQIELAAEINVSDKAISRWESGVGTPELENLCRLSEFFGVTVDYLLTGKEQKEETRALSKLEVCAVQDDADSAEKLFYKTDEDNKTLADYAIQYNSTNLIEKLIQICSDNNLRKDINYYSIIKLMTKTLIDMPDSAIIALIQQNRELALFNFIKRFQGDYYFSYDSYFNKPQKHKEVFECVVQNYNNLSPEQQKFYFGDEISFGWRQAYPLLLRIAVEKHNYKLTEVLIESIKTANKLEGYTKPPKYRKSGKYEYIKPDIKTVEIAYRTGNKRIGDIVNELAENVIDEYQAKIYLLIADDKKTHKEKLIEAANHYGILCIEDILKINDIKVIEEQLNKFPIHFAELIAKLVIKKQFGQAADYLRKFGLDDIAGIFERKNMKEIENCLSEIWVGNLWNECEPIYGAKATTLITINEKYLTDEYRKPIYHIDDIINATNACRNKILKSLT